MRRTWTEYVILGVLTSNGPTDFGDLCTMAGLGRHGVEGALERLTEQHLVESAHGKWQLKGDDV